MKKVFMPSMDELYMMQDKGVNIYRYLIIKNIESILCDRVGSIRGILDKDLLYNISKLKNGIDILMSIFRMYPNEVEKLIEYDKDGKIGIFSMIDTKLCFMLLDLCDEHTEKHKNGLDYLSYFSSDVVRNNFVLRRTIELLQAELTKNPRYRFEYCSDDKNNTLLEDIFNCRIDDGEMMFLKKDLRENAIKKLTSIEPAYSVILPSNYFYFEGYNDPEQVKGNLLCQGMNDTANRYGIDGMVGIEYYRKDILTDQDEEVKKLMKCIKR